MVVVDVDVVECFFGACKSDGFSWDLSGRESAFDGRRQTDHASEKKAGRACAFENLEFSCLFNLFLLVVLDVSFLRE